MKTAKEIRNDFLEFFKNNDHKIVKSTPVVPQDDPTLLFVNAGMNQFKSVFLNQEKPSYPRIADTQKCIRVSGKHNDLEEVGRDTYHHTFFEMLGNWSFGDYYKKEAIEYAWKLFTETWGFSKDRLWASVYTDDNEAAKLWEEVTDIAPDRILRFGKKDNFWEMGDTGPCGPCSEIHYYMGDDPENQDKNKVNADDAEYIELWNLVFMQYNRDITGKLNPLPAKHVDTGAGFERIVAAIQGKKSNYDTDLFMPIINKIVELTGKKYSQETGTPHRVIADHIKMLSFSIADGGLPSNDGRGYVIRRILRRAARFGKMLDMHEPFIYKLLDSVIEIYQDTFQELVDRKDHIKKVIKVEEESFSETLERGLAVFDKIVEKDETKKVNQISGKDAFKLYDTYGFPFDLTVLIAEEKNLTVDHNGFNIEMEIQKEKARASIVKVDYSDLSNKWTVVSKGDDSQFIGYENDETEAVIRKYIHSEGKFNLILDKTVFYAESGGEVGDTGVITGDNFTIQIEDTQKTNDSYVHIGKIINGKFNENSKLKLSVDISKSNKIRANHTATHLAHQALKEIVGNHVNQAGSYVNDERLRFDLTHYEKVKDEELRKIEQIVNEKIRANIPVVKELKSYDEAKESGAMALFGEKYGDVVRIVEIGDFSKEFCGGKHVARTGDIGLFKIISETSVASGVRRIEALTGEAAYNDLIKNEQILSNLEKLTVTPKVKLEEKIKQMQSDFKKLQKQLAQQATKGWEEELDQIIADAKIVGDLKVVTYNPESKDMNDLKKIGDIIRNKIKQGVGAVISVTNGKPTVAVVVADATIKEHGLKAGDIVKELGKVLGGGGGGRPHMATAGGRIPENIPQAFEKLFEIIEKKITK